MFDPIHDDTRPDDESLDTDRNVKIEQLLLSGLDHYFKGRYEHAVDVWTRVLFLDRSHARARAYIERARAALAERLRESEELVHTGVEAFNRGDVAEARTLLTSAVHRGGGRDEALTVLERLNRLEGASGEDIVSRRGGHIGPLGRALIDQSDVVPVRRVRVMPLVLLVIIVAAVGYVAVSWGEWRTLLSGTPQRVPARSLVAAEPLHVPSATEVRLARARRLVAEQRPHEALSVLSEVEVGDPLAGEVESLTAMIQKQLLATTETPPELGSPVQDGR